MNVILQMRRRLAAAWFNLHGGSRCSFSQCGEDLILDFAFRYLGVEHPTYLDIGAHHPRYLSNTAFFYRNGSRGVNVEPDPALFREIRRVRPRDVNLNLGVSDAGGSQDLFVMSAPELNTFSKEEAEKIAAGGNVRIVSVQPIEMRSVGEIFSEHFAERPPDLLSLDAEGMDLRILQAINFQRHGPLAICVETVDYQPDSLGGKRSEVADFLRHVGYMVYADTYINTLFFKQERFEQRVRSTQPDR